MAKGKMKSGLAAIRKPSDCDHESEMSEAVGDFAPMASAFESKPKKFGKKTLSKGNKPTFGIARKNAK
jgi:hypothetical protein